MAVRGGGVVRRRTRWLLAGAAVVGSAAAAVAAVNLTMVLGGRDDVTTVAEAPRADVALVLGARVYPGGTMSPMLRDRVERAAQLYEAGKVSKVIVSGDHGRWEYNEPFPMRDALIERGVPPQDVFTDHAGFDTWASMRRAREVFGARSAVVVTQAFHMPRALYLAGAAGLDATGVTSDIQDYGPSQRSSEAREVLARVKAFGSATVNADVMLGPEISLEGDGRVSWGPEHPPA